MQSWMLAIAVCFTAGALTLPANAQTATADGDLIVENAWTRANGNIGGSAEVFFTIRNTGAELIDLIGVRTDVASIETLHRSTISTTGVSRMSAMPELRVEPLTSVTLEPGGLHVMLIDLETPLVAGEILPLRLTFYDGDDLTIDVPILASEAAGPPDSASAD